MSETRQLDPEAVANWFFRLNGCFTIPNFIVHPDMGSDARTDVDVLAVRYPHRAELASSGNPMQDHEVFTKINKCQVILAEVKTGRCKLNPTWTNPAKENFQRMLRAVGAFPVTEIDVIASSLYTTGSAVSLDGGTCVRVFVIGSEPVQPAASARTGAVRVTWTQIAEFIHQRFRAYLEQKKNVGQWDETGKLLHKNAENFHDCSEYSDWLIENLKPRT